MLHVSIRLFFMWYLTLFDIINIPSRCNLTLKKKKIYLSHSTLVVTRLVHNKLHAINYLQSITFFGGFVIDQLPFYMVMLIVTDFFS